MSAAGKCADSSPPRLERPDARERHAARAAQRERAGGEAGLRREGKPSRRLPRLRFREGRFRFPGRGLLRASRRLLRFLRRFRVRRAALRRELERLLRRVGSRSGERRLLNRRIGGCRRFPCRAVFRGGVRRGGLLFRDSQGGRRVFSRLGRRFGSGCRAFLLRGFLF